MILAKEYLNQQLSEEEVTKIKDEML